MNEGTDRVLVLDDKFDLSEASRLQDRGYRAVIGLFWMAPSTKELLSRSTGGECYGLRDLIKDVWEWTRAAFDLVEPIVEKGPRYKNLPWLVYLMESLYREAMVVELLRRSARLINELKMEWQRAEIRIHSYLAPQLVSVFASLLEDYQGLVLIPRNFSGRRNYEGLRRLTGIKKRLIKAYRTGDWKTQIIESFEAVDRTYFLRTWISGWKDSTKHPVGGTTFFSSYRNNTQTLLPFADLVPRPVHWVFTNHSARSVLRDSCSTYSWIWEFYGATVNQKKIGKDNVINDNKLHANDRLIERWLANSPTWSSWKNVEFSMLERLTRCWEKYLDRVSPSLIVMANQWGIEGWFLRIARQRKIPVLQVMHGALGGHLHTRTPIASDLLVVPGDFWRDLWPKSEREKILVFSPKNDIQEIRQDTLSRPITITYFSTPFNELVGYNPSEFLNGLIKVFRNLLCSEKVDRIIIRIHPQENPSEFVNRWKKFNGRLPKSLVLSSTEPLDAVLSETDLAVMYRSTVMLDCLVKGIPIITPGWIDFGWNEALGKSSTVCLAEDFGDFENKVETWRKNPPKATAREVERFVKSRFFDDENPRGEKSAIKSSLFKQGLEKKGFVSGLEAFTLAQCLFAA